MSSPYSSPLAQGARPHVLHDDSQEDGARDPVARSLFAEFEMIAEEEEHLGQPSQSCP